MSKSAGDVPSRAQTAPLGSGRYRFMLFLVLVALNMLRKALWG